MVVRVAQRAAASGAHQVVVAADSERHRRGVCAARLRRRADPPDHATGTDRIAEAAVLLGLGADVDRRQCPGRRAADARGRRCARRRMRWPSAPTARSRPRATRSHDAARVLRSQRGQGGDRPTRDARSTSRARRSRGPRRVRQRTATQPAARAAARRHLGIYAYRAGFLRRFRAAACRAARAARKPRTAARAGPRTPHRGRRRADRCHPASIRRRTCRTRAQPGVAAIAVHGPKRPTLAEPAPATEHLWPAARSG